MNFACGIVLSLFELGSDRGYRELWIVSTEHSAYLHPCHQIRVLHLNWKRHAVGLSFEELASVFASPLFQPLSAGGLTVLHLVLTLLVVLTPTATDLFAALVLISL